MKNYLGIDDDEFVRGKVPMTKKEVRILAVAAAHLAEDSIVLDVGAGTGSLSVEAARQSPFGRVFAIEKNPAAVELLEQNRARFGLNNLEIIKAQAPDGISSLPELDAVFVGGSGSRLTDILDAAGRRLRAGAHSIVTSVTIQTTSLAIDYFRRHSNYRYETISVQINRLRQLGSFDMNEALNLVYIINAVKLP